MKNSTLVFRSLTIIIFIAGGAHLFTFASQNSGYNYQIEDTNNTDVLSDKEQTTSFDYNTDFILGKWKVTYNSKEFNGAVVYEIKKKDNRYNAYTYQYLDKDGYAEKAEQTKILSIKSFDGLKGKGTYSLEYEGEKYAVDCTIEVQSATSFVLKYDAYGYKDTETWIKQ